MNGHMLTFPSIAIDFWNLTFCSDVQYLFLTHIHCDHIKGLNSNWSKPIYCSSITRKLLLNKLKIDEKLVHGLDLNMPIYFKLVSNNETMKVTLVDANHCPGSVMFHFEGSFGQILYTGDFRYSYEMCKHLLTVIPDFDVDHLYVDDTNWNCGSLPSREEAIDEVLCIIENHPCYRILIGLYTVGKEYLLESICSKLDTPVYVSQKRKKVLDIVGFKGQIVTDSNDSSIHVVERWTIHKEMKMLKNENPTIAIIPSSYLGKEKLDNPDVYFVPLSDHSSHNELCTFIGAIKPRLVTGITKYSGKANAIFNNSKCQQIQTKLFSKLIRNSKKMFNKHKIPLVMFESEDDNECNQKINKSMKHGKTRKWINCCQCGKRSPFDDLKYNRNMDFDPGLCSPCDIALSQTMERRDF